MPLISNRSGRSKHARQPAKSMVMTRTRCTGESPHVRQEVQQAVCRVGITMRVSSIAGSKAIPAAARLYITCRAKSNEKRASLRAAYPGAKFSCSGTSSACRDSFYRGARKVKSLSHQACLKCYAIKYSNLHYKSRPHRVFKQWGSIRVFIRHPGHMK